MNKYNFTYSKRGLALTEQFEGLRLSAYRDSGGVITEGYGHTGRDAQIGDVITLAQAEQLLLDDVANAEATVNDLVTIPGLNQDEFDALVDFVFNVGSEAFAQSTLLRDLNAGNLEAAANQFVEWDHVNGQIVAGLLRRRQAEQSLFRGTAA